MRCATCRRTFLDCEWQSPSQMIGIHSRDRDVVEMRGCELPSLIRSTVTRKNMPPESLLTSAGWSLNGLLTQGDRFREIPRISVSDKNLDATIRDHESSGVPLVIEGMHEHQAWPTAMFDIQWLRDNLKQRELGRLVS